VHESGLKIGDLIWYLPVSDDGIGIVYGIITEFSGWREEARGEAVSVVWMDDGVPTYESIKSIVGDSPDYNYIGVAGESR
tara:strand:- start:637 stop:876 length:240 start_codon:yes stop_codon:yes gene_type:complete